MSERLPNTVQYHELVERRSTVRGMVRVAELARLAAAAMSGDQQLAVELSFDREGRTDIVRGTIRGEVLLQCQRCLGGMSVPVDIELALALLHSEAEVAGLTADLEPAIVPSHTISLHDLVEDEVLLVLPIVALHDGDDCAIDVAQIEDEALPDEQQTARPNPFAVLAGLKGKSTKH